MSAFRFYAETNPLGPAVDLIWELPDPAQSPDEYQLSILRKKRRFPGKSRRGALPVKANMEDLTDGIVVYDSSTYKFDLEKTREEIEGDRLISITRQYLYQGDPRDRILIRSIHREFPIEGGVPITAKVRFIDREGLTPGNIYYYTAFVGTEKVFSCLTQASSLATGRFGYSLFALLPHIDQSLDTILPSTSNVSLADQYKGQLQRLLEVFDAHADMFHGYIDGLRDIHNIRKVDSTFLSHLAQLIGWKLKDHLDEEEQRNEIIFAPEVYQTVGTEPNIAAMVNRLTGWGAQIREFACNVLLSFETARLEELQSGVIVYLDGSLTPSPTPPPHLHGHHQPPGSVDTTDAVAMFKLRTKAFDDQTAYSYDCGQPDGNGGYLKNDEDLYNRETIGIYIIPDIETEPFSLQEEWKRIGQILADFLPIQVRAVFIVQPSVFVEEEYDATQRVVEEFFSDRGILVQEETYGESIDESLDRISGWHWFVTNDLIHRSLNIAAVPVDTTSRTWHTGLAQAL
jgi:hypothetical protein